MLLSEGVTLFLLIRFLLEIFQKFLRSRWRAEFLQFYNILETFTVEEASLFLLL